MASRPSPSLDCGYPLTHDAVPSAAPGPFFPISPTTQIQKPSMKNPFDYQIKTPRFRTVLGLLAATLIPAGSLLAGIMGNGVNIQPFYYNGGNPNLALPLMRQNPNIKTVRIMCSAGGVAQAKSWITQVRANGYTILATFQGVAGSDSVSDLTKAANFWKTNYPSFSSGGSFWLNLCNEWSSHNMSANSFSSAYNSAIPIVRQVYSGRIIVDCGGWAQEATRMFNSVTGSGGTTKINDVKIVPSMHLYPGAFNGGAGRGVNTADIDLLNTCGRSCIVGEFGGTTSNSWVALVDRAKSHGWTVIGWSWNGDGGTMNMLSPSWASNGSATSFTKSSYFNTIYSKL